MLNNLKTTVLLAALTGILLAIGDLWRGQSGMELALIIAAVMNIGSYFFSDKIALRSSGAQPISREENPRIYQIVERLAAKANVPVPKIYWIPTDSPNAFATGRNPNHASVAVTRGILELCDDEEIEGVLAHELGHVRNRDILISAVVATVAGAITLLARMIYWGELFTGYGGRDRDQGGGIFSALAMMILAPLAATLIQLAISRSREYEADHTGAEITGNPMGLARALDKIDKYSKRLPMRVAPSMAHIYCAQPLTTGQVFSGLFSTHPPIAKRIERLIGRDFV
ncbi:MAG TPA: zinc metalloprotease HtpX [Terriglobia bacterium]|jgi:heat shock protein HtpX|nr:zinc metalloprotease HtpX [Terriglobia bacterium]